MTETELEAQLAEMAAELLDRYEELNLLYDLGGSLASVFDTDRICAIALDKAAETIGSAQAVVALTGPEGVEVAAARGGAVLDEGGISEHVAVTGREVLLHENEPAPDGVIRTGRESVLSVPLLPPRADMPIGARLVYAHADLIAPVVEFNRRWELPFGANPARIRPIYNGVDPGLFVPRPKPSESANGPVAVAAARIFPLKDIETMIRSAAVAARLVPEITFRVYGSLDADAPYVERCQALIRQLGLEHVFELRGFHSKPAELYSEGEISVLSSISEAFPYTVLESMACARPCVGTDVGGVGEALDGFGLVVPPRDPEAFGRAVATLLSDDEFRRELGRRAREQVLARYRTSRSVNAYAAAYDELVAPR